jgi:CTP:phosphocholine cytidylyltransferase-like protein
MSTLNDAEILDATSAKEQPDKTLLATYVLPDGEEFQGKFSDKEQMRKLALQWCETVRAHWDAKEARKLSPLPEDDAPVKQEKPVKLGANATQQFILEQVRELTQSIEDLERSIEFDMGELEEKKALREELLPLVEKWGLLDHI